MSKNPYLVLAIGDPYLVGQALEKHLASLVLNSPENAVEKIFAQDADWTKILGQARTYPFFSDKQVFWIKNAEMIEDETIELLRKYFEQSVDFTYFFFETESFAGKKKMIDFVTASGGQLLDLASASGSGPAWRNRSEQIAGFIREKSKSLKIRLTREAGRLLEEYLGDHFLLLNQALEKLSLKGASGVEMTEKDVEALAEEIDRATGFDLAEALSAKNMSRVFEIYFQLYEENPYQASELLGLLNWQMKRLYEAKRLVGSGASRQELAAKLKIRPYFLDRLLTQIKTFDETRLRNAFCDLAQTDEWIKRGKVEVAPALELLLLRLGLS